MEDKKKKDKAFQNKDEDTEREKEKIENRENMKRKGIKHVKEEELSIYTLTSFIGTICF